jgi:hypothetical protein
LLAETLASPDGDRAQPLLDHGAACGSLRCFFRVVRVFRGSIASLRLRGEREDRWGDLEIRKSGKETAEGIGREWFLAS